MDNSKFDIKIKDLEEQINILHGPMENTCKELLEETKEFVVTWSQSRVESAIISHPEIAKECGVEGLHKLKSDLQKMIAMVPSIVEEHLNNDKYWAHRGNLTYDSNHLGPYRVYGNNRVPDELNNGVRELLGYVGAILIEHGFADTKQYGEWEMEGFERLIYKYGYDWSEKMITVLKRYSDMYDELIKLDVKLKKVIREKAEAEAKSLWDEA